ncbi:MULTISPECIES: hypothetical protein [Acetobacter]|uniref:Uncharacterized protein n=4 Tax=Acetobacter TaxID=434 RepID=A0A841QJH5_9PROT|nr:hypothetical protein [Acetobacter lovaniensis]MBB6458566.1 hypothetical protein [Acetobacter lovaniensis]MCI1698940.1 hypothetical protein [Acetobacter lovaniensis]MCP1240752.1 hypothetical protein [Acetobacter lovaniensis]NHN82786.1 hypothetical protein [Acetobacter lovaniensis]
MREELMVEALCWETQSKVHVFYAAENRRLSYFCPDEHCLTRVYPKTIINTYFYAESGHKTGCLNEAGSHHSDPAQTGRPRPKPSALPPPPIPNWLGMPPRPQRRMPPSEEQLIALARTAKTAPPLYPATMSQIVDAWLMIPDTERKTHALGINTRQLNYQSAFTYIRYLQNDITTLDCDNHIIYGDATVSRGKKYYFVSSIKRFSFQNTNLPLRFDLPIEHPFARKMADYIGRQVLLFWRGPVPAINAKKTAYQMFQPDDTGLSGLIMRPSP